ncbi:hypothetical protein HZP85_13190 [Elizabethkingia anophelis]|nr:hypothetical protein [Elizabethkingia anophelis]
MKAAENLALLQKIANSLGYLEVIGNINSIDKELIDDLLLYSNVDENAVYQDLIEKQNFRILIKEFLTLICKIEESLLMVNTFFGKDSIDYAFDRIMAPYKFKWQLAYDEIRPYSEKRDDLNGRLESWVYSYADESSEIIKLRNDLEIAKNEYKIYQKKLNDAYDDERKAFNNNSYILSFKLSNFVEKLNVVKSNIARLSNSDAFSQELFRDEEAIELAYFIFVKSGYVKTISRPDFYNQISLNTPFSIEKNKNKDKYIAYSINKVKEFIVESKKEIWENEMIKGFEIQNYDKVKTVKKSERKTDEHTQIDSLITKYLEDSKFL